MLRSLLNHRALTLSQNGGANKRRQRFGFRSIEGTQQRRTAVENKLKKFNNKELAWLIKDFQIESRYTGQGGVESHLNATNKDKMHTRMNNNNKKSRNAAIKAIIRSTTNLGEKYGYKKKKIPLDQLSLYTFSRDELKYLINQHEAVKEIYSDIIEEGAIVI